MRMPILAYFIVMGAALIGLLLVSSYELPDVGSPIKTSQLAGLPKVEARPDIDPMMTTSSNFAAPEKEIQAVQSVNGIHAEQINADKSRSVHPVKRQLAERDSASTAHQPRVAEYSHDVLMGIH
jgi:hypothetical protein